jgi:hypothetical protein
VAGLITARWSRAPLSLYRDASRAALLRAAANNLTSRNHEPAGAGGGGGFTVSGFGDIDPAAAGRAAEASAAIFARYEGLIGEVSRNPALSPQQRAAAIVALRHRQSAEAAGVSKQIMAAAKGAATLRRKMMKRGRRTRKP